MGFWKKLEEYFFTGKVLEDYGAVYRHRPFPWWTVEYRVLLTEKKGEKRVIIKQKSGARGEVNRSYHEFDLEGAKRLYETLGEILKIS